MLKRERGKEGGKKEKKSRDSFKKLDKVLISNEVPGLTSGRSYFCLAFCCLAPTLITPIQECVGARTLGSFCTQVAREDPRVLAQTLRWVKS
jgi:hypothetical protein